MRRTLLFIALILMSATSFAQDRVEVVYSGMKFSIPDGVSVVGDLGGKGNLLVFRYGNGKGKRFLAFTDMTNDTTIDYGCSVGRFFEAVFSNKRDTSCNQSALQAIRGAFVENRKVATWTGAEYTAYYSADDNKTFVFISGQADKLIKLDSDFIRDDEYRKILPAQSK